MTLIARTSTSKKAEALKAFYETPQRPLTVTYSESEKWPRYPYALHDSGDAPDAATEPEKASTSPARSA